MNDAAELELAFKLLVDAAVDACSKGPSTSDFEPEFVRVLDFVKTHPQMAESVERVFLRGLMTNALPDELISFCMHTLKLPAIKQAVCARLDRNPGPAGMESMSRVLASFDENWSDKVLYEYYSGVG